MKWVSYIIALLLALVTAGVGLFFIGAQEQHEELLTYHLWSTLILRFLFASSLGLVGAGLWWAFIGVLAKKRITQYTDLRKLAWVLLASVLGGSCAGAVSFCFL